MRRGNNSHRGEKAMANDDDRADAEVRAFLQNELMKEAKDYLDRGRRFEKLARAELEAKWVAAFRLFAKQHIGDHVTDMEDAHAELRLRGLDIPEEAVKAELEVMRAEIERDGPASAPPDLRERLDAFRAERDKPKH
jgi:hypothetical protein